MSAQSMALARGALRQRLVVAAIGIPVVAAVVYVGGIVIPVALIAVAGLAAAEARSLFSRVNLGFPLWLATVPPVVAIASGWLGLSLTLAGLTALGLASLWCVIQTDGEHPPVTRAAVAAFVALYLGLPLGLAASLSPVTTESAVLPLGPATWIVVVLGLTWATDSAAYLVGRVVGRRRLAPRISPGKTIEGTVGGLVAAAIAAVGFGMLLQTPPLLAGPLGLAAGVAAVTGDLFESAMKRVCGAKDSGSIFPGHGGMLDRIDSILFVIPVVAVWALIVTGGISG